MFSGRNALSLALFMYPVAYVWAIGLGHIFVPALLDPLSGLRE